ATREEPSRMPPEEVCRSTPRSEKRQTPRGPLALGSPPARHERGRDQIDGEREGDRDDRRREEDCLREGGVSLVHGYDHHLAEAVEVEDGLREQRSADQPGEIADDELRRGDRRG